MGWEWTTLRRMFLGGADRGMGQGGFVMCDGRHGVLG